MSYCRFSSDQFRSDVYVYDHVGGWVQIHVAGNRLTSNEPRPTDSWGEEMSAWLDRAKREPITLDHAGEEFQFNDHGEAADMLVTLRVLGYYVPQYAIEGLRAAAAMAPTAATTGEAEK